MLRLVLLAALVYSTNGSVRKLIPRIKGGEEAGIKDYPYQVALETPEGTFVCGGSILDSLHVLTAAHCIIPHQQYTRRVRAGSSVRYRSGSTHTLLHIFKHEKADLAVIRLHNEIEFDETKQPIRLFDEGEAAQPGELATVSGWGSAHPEGEGALHLRATRVPIVSRSKCNYAYWNSPFPRRVVAGEICAGSLGKPSDRDICFGDSGGALVIGGRQAGIASKGRECGQLGLPSIFVEVAFYRKWIDEMMTKELEEVNFWDGKWSFDDE